MNKKIQTALISVFYKTGLETIAKKLHALGVTIYSTGGTQQFLNDINNIVSTYKYDKIKIRGDI